MTRRAAWLLPSVVLVLGGPRCAKHDTTARSGSAAQDGSPSKADANAQAPGTLADLVARRDRKAIVEFKRKQERGWSPDWVLSDVRLEEVDEFKQGVILEWTRREVEGTRKRKDAFSNEGSLLYATEEWTQGPLHAFGRVRFDQTGSVADKDFAVYRDRSQPLYFELEVVRSGGSSMYRAPTTFHRDPFTNRVDELAAGTKLVSGSGDPSIEALRSASTPRPRRLVRPAPDRGSR